jgi:ribosomal-protein-alanine N-acetyltransferase
MGPAGPAAARTVGDVVIERLRWWHIAELLPIEGDLFGAERWSATMFWTELASRHYYRIARDAADDKPGDIIGYAGLAVGPGEAWVQNIAVRRDRQGGGVGAALLDDLLAAAASAPSGCAADTTSRATPTRW